MGFLPRFLGGGGGSANFSESCLRDSTSKAASSKPSAIVFVGSGNSSTAGGGEGGVGVSGSGDGVSLRSYIETKQCKFETDAMHNNHELAFLTE